jgi:hypothetical protein
MIDEHDRVVLTADFPEPGLDTGDVGTVVHIYDEHRAYEVEFVTLHGETVAVITVEDDQLRPVRKQEITQARSLA